MRAKQVLALGAAIGSAALVASGVAVESAAAGCKPTRLDSITIRPPVKLPAYPHIVLTVVYTSTDDEETTTTMHFTGTETQYYDYVTYPGRNVFSGWFAAPTSYTGWYEKVEFWNGCDMKPSAYRLRIPRPGEAPITITPQQPGSAGCSRDEVLDLHGSGAKAGDDTKVGRQFAAALHKLHPARSIRLVPVPFAAAGGAALVGAVLGMPGPYHNSVVKMKNWLRSKLEALAKKCPASRVFLVGISQGAQAAGDVFAERAWPQVKGVALFGDTKYNHRDKVDRFGLNVSPKYRHVNLLDGSLGIRPVWEASKTQRVLSFCHLGDPVCGANIIALLLERFKQHDNYGHFGEPQMAARRFG